MIVFMLNNVTVEDNVRLGNRVLILPVVTIGEGAVIQAGSTVVSNINALCIAGGHPARVFSKRDADHYCKLKSEKEFH